MLDYDCELVTRVDSENNVFERLASHGEVVSVGHETIGFCIMIKREQARYIVGCVCTKTEAAGFVHCAQGGRRKASGKEG